MSTITKECAELKAFITGFLSDPMHDDKSSSSLTAEVFRIALASLEAEAVGCDACGGNGSVDIDHGEMGIEHIECPKCYTAPPAPVSDADLLHMAASAIDSISFPLIAFGSLMPGIIAGQFIAKVCGGFVWSLILRKR